LASELSDSFSDEVFSVDFDGVLIGILEVVLEFTAGDAFELDVELV